MVTEIERDRPSRHVLDHMAQAAARKPRFHDCYGRCIAGGMPRVNWREASCMSSRVSRRVRRRRGPWSEAMADSATHRTLPRPEL
jgi:hypothetical protein